MTSHARVLASARFLGRGLLVVVLMLSALVALTFAILADPTNMVDSSDTLSDLGAVRFLLGAVGICLLPFMHRIPLILVVVGGFLSVVAGTDPVVLTSGLAVWISRAQNRMQWWVAGLGFTALAGSAARFSVLTLVNAPVGSARIELTLLLTCYLLLVLIILGVGLWNRQRNRAMFASAAAKAALKDNRQLSGELVRQREREELAREVHDTLASRLSVIALQTGSLEQEARTVGDPTLEEALKTVQSNASNALDDLRSLLSSLRAGGAPARAPQRSRSDFSDLQDLFDDARSAGLQLTPYVVVTDYASAPAVLRRAATRITQEALTNALRHSSDRELLVRIEGGPTEGLTLSFSNRYGYGPNEFAHGSHIGILGMKERATLVGGTVDVVRSNGQFSLNVHLPWSAHVVPQD